MAYEFYNIQLANTPSPTNEIKADLQSSINDLFEIASDVYTIEYETATPNVFTNMVVRLEAPYKIENQSSIKDDFKHIIFKDFTVKPKLGEYFRFDGYYWLVIDTGRFKSSTNSVMVRRCGDFLRFYDSDGVYHALPCVLERSVMYDLNKDIYIALPDNQTRVLVKYNTESKKIKYADLGDAQSKYTRFILEELPFKTVSLDRSTFIRLSVGYMDIRLQSDQKNDYDDLVNGIADTNKNIILSTPTVGFDIQFNPIITSMKIGETKLTNVTFTNASTLYSDTPTWQIRTTDGITLSNLATISSSTNSSCTIKASSSSADVGKIFRLYCIGTNKTSYLEITIKSLFSGGV